MAALRPMPTRRQRAYFNGLHVQNQKHPFRKCPRRSRAGFFVRAYVLVKAVPESRRPRWTSPMYLVAPIFLIPFFGWGLFSLHWKYRRREDWPLWVEALTVAGLAVFYALEIDELRVWLQHQRIAYFFSVLGLFVAGLALYGHVVVSLLSRLIVEVVAPGEEDSRDRPRFGPAEILERQGDWEGALQEYLILLRIFPRNPMINQRAAECCMQLKRPEEAVKWMERAMRDHPPDEKILPLLSRICEIYDRVLRRPDDARKVLDRFLVERPAFPLADEVQARRRQIGAAVSLERPLGLDALAETPLEDGAFQEETPKRVKTSRRARREKEQERQVAQIESLDDCPAPLSDSQPDELTLRDDLPEVVPLDASEDTPQEDKALDSPRGKSDGASIEPL